MKTITLNIDGQKIDYDTREDIGGIRLEDIVRDYEDRHKGKICIANVGNKIRALDYVVDRDSDIKFIDTTEDDGMRVYFRVLSFILMMACKELYCGKKIVIEHSLSNGLYCQIKNGIELTDEEVKRLKTKMCEIISKDIKIEKLQITRDEAIAIFTREQMYDKVELMKYRDEGKISIYKCGNHYDYYYGYMLPSTGWVDIFSIERHNHGIILFGPDNNDKNVPIEFIPQPKLANIYNETEKWSELMGIDTVIALNKVIENNEYGELIRIVEALQDKKLAKIADEISQNKKRIILIAAPSSSGKTSFARRLEIQLKVNNMIPISISLDNYFLDREMTPLDENGNIDFESIYAIDIAKFNEDLQKLIDGEEIDDIRFDFASGKRIITGKKIRIGENHPIILEGIHGLNPILTKDIDDSQKFKIYISALTQLNLDNTNSVATRDLRLIRRIVRDHNFRSYSAEKTILQWEYVRRGEKENIFPFQEEADVMFNSACAYELSVLKVFARPLLEEIDEESPAFIEANRLLSFLRYFEELKDTSDIPPTSITREFIGGSRIVD
ncbi:MAG: nucleoside kinase [Clostridioides sp.]|jgi:uridine kinase|nr:nucleoside kinase [Clostridioides sp.]